MKDIEEMKEKCESCGTTENIEFCPDPFAEDVYNEIRLCWLCPDCYNAYCDDI